MTINECKQYCKEVVTKFLQTDAKKFLNDYGFAVEMVWDHNLNDNYLGLYIGTIQNDTAVFPIAINPKAIYEFFEEEFGYVGYEDVEFAVKSTMWHEIGHGVCAYLEFDSYDEESVCEEFSNNMMENKHSGKLIAALNKYVSSLQESLSNDDAQIVDEFLQTVKNKLTSSSTNYLIDYLNVPIRRTFDEESPMFILPDGGIISVGDVLDVNEQYLPFDIENIHSNLIKCFILKYAHDNGLTWDMIDELNDYYSGLDICEDIIADYVYKYNWAKINCGETWEEDRFYTVLPNKVSLPQYRILEDWLEWGVDMGKDKVLIFVTDAQDYYQYPLDSEDLFPEDIIKRIKRRYSSGVFHEKLSLKEFLNEEYDLRGGIRYDHYSTGVIGDQVNFVVVATKDDVVIGYVQYGYYKDTVNIQMIKVADEYRRQGIGTKMMQYLQKQYPDTEINPGMTTPDGTEFIKNLFVEVPSPEKQKLFNRKKRWEKAYYKAAEEQKKLEKELDDFYETPDEEITDEYREHIQEVGDKWQELYDRMRDLDRKLWDFHMEYGKMTSPTKKLVKGEF